MARTKKHPKTKTWLISRNYSDRIPGVHISQIAVHTTESHPRPGVSDLTGLRNYFNTAGVEASSHYGVQDVDIWQFVSDSKKAWTIGVANSWTLNIEIIGFAAMSVKQWMTGTNYRSLKSTAKLIAYLSLKHDLPIQKGSLGSAAGQLFPVRRGEIRHSDVTKAGFGTHTDPGSGFPLKLVLRWARWYAKHGWVV